MWDKKNEKKKYIYIIYCFRKICQVEEKATEFVKKATNLKKTTKRPQQQQPCILYRQKESKERPCILAIHKLKFDLTSLLLKVHEYEFNLIVEKPMNMFTIRAQCIRPVN